ncbi:uncharacterized protein LOC103580082 isoform X1 [Microplitis demolitor]|uniref:uncharacterized protein LOC103580082 isoform X1 n=1 Tax=Microplitis demolitor TaxID=69319 RepID=UPI0004CC9FB9|nr:uncharacterized protein LOC103580082 isoform X1 [Microplitis demolitor]
MQDTSESDGSFFVVEVEMEFSNFWVVILENWMLKEDGSFTGYCKCPDTFSHFTDLNLIINTDANWRERRIVSNFMEIPRQYTVFDTFEEARQAAQDRNRLRTTESQINKSIEYLKTLEELRIAKLQLEYYKRKIEYQISYKIEVLENMLPIKTSTVLRSLEMELIAKYSPMSLACKLLFDTLIDKRSSVETLYKILNAFFTADSRFLCIEVDDSGNSKLQNSRILEKINTYLNFGRRQVVTDDLMKDWFLKK